jgi:dCMP deaminase
MKSIFFVYIPVLHEGYRRFFDKYPEAKTLYILGADMIAKTAPLPKDIRALPPGLIKKSLEAWGRFDDIEVADEKTLTELKNFVGEIVLPDEDVMREIAARYFPNAKIIWDSIFLRWDKHKSMEERPVEADQKVSRSEFDRQIISKLKNKAEKSSDFWRRIASAIVKDGRVLLMAYNEHLPSAHSPYAEGDPRNNFHKGVNIEISTALHGEAGLIAEAARKGIALEGADMYVTVFPCPPCAKQIAFSGIKRLFYAGGYSVLNQERILRSKGVEIIFVE